MRIIRVFPRRTAATPVDDLVRIGTEPDLFDEADEVHISVAFTWDLPLAEKLTRAWAPVAPVRIGGPATGEPGGEFVPGRYVKAGYVVAGVLRSAAEIAPLAGYARLWCPYKGES